MAKIGIIGAGAFGSALANLLAKNGHQVLIWAFEKDVCAQINKNKINPQFFGQIKIEPKVDATTDLEEVFNFSHIIIEAIPISFLRGILEKANEFCTSKHSIICATKGIESGTLMLASQVIESTLKNVKNVAVFSGPTFSQDLASGEKCCATLASKDPQLLKKLLAIFNSQNFKAFESCDLIGVQILGALKNVYSFLLSIFKGSGICSSTQAYQLFLATLEIRQFLKAMDGKEATLFSPAGIADFMMTLHSLESRNTKVGLAIGQGQKAEEVLKNFQTPPEGYVSLLPAQQLAKQLGLKLEILSQNFVN